MSPIPDPAGSSNYEETIREFFSLTARATPSRREIVADPVPSSRPAYAAEAASAEINDVRSRMLEIVVKVASGQSENLSFKVPSTYTVRDLKLAISEKMDLPPEQQRLIFFGKMLQDNSQKLREAPLKMKAEGINYVHLCPTPSPPPQNSRGRTPRAAAGIASSSARRGPAPQRDIDVTIAFARRLGRSRRRRDRDRQRSNPYSSPSSRNSVTGTASAGHAASRATVLDLVASIHSHYGARRSEEEDLAVPQNVPSSPPQGASESSMTQVQAPHAATGLLHSLLTESYPPAVPNPVVSLPVPIILPSMMLPPTGLGAAPLASVPRESPSFPRENQFLVASLASRFMENITESSVRLQNLVLAGIAPVNPTTYQGNVEQTIEALENLSESAGSLAVRYREILENPDGSPEARAAAMREASETVAETAQALQAALGQSLVGALASPPTAAAATHLLGYLDSILPPAPLRSTPHILSSYSMPVARMPASYSVPPPPPHPIYGSISSMMPGLTSSSQSGISGLLNHSTPMNDGSQPFRYPYGWF